ncbi:hypothetical protein [Virgibacillus sp. MSP4-1]|uniref:hypothetical protein n=1 Tax=Virgibacillus sp. MSP4-1 TaxID=2700081 RepID=UPI0003A7A050|nr:hypothetical protein [Virgibacillus sp. MSP4-1]
MEFTGVVALTFLLYAIRRASKISNRHIPLAGIILGIGFAAFEAKGFSFDIFMTGLQYALYAVGMVAGYKYSREKPSQKNISLLTGLKKGIELFTNKKNANTDRNGRKKGSSSLPPQDRQSTTENTQENKRKEIQVNSSKSVKNEDLPVSGEADI